MQVYRAHAEAARTLGKTLIIHTREADDAMGGLLEEEAGKGPLRILMHCYTSGAELARRALALGGYISFSGIMTFKNADDVRAVALETPLDRIIVETDCPYLAPVPHRGQRCEPAHVADVQRYLCKLRGLEEEEGAALLADNFFRVAEKVRDVPDGDARLLQENPRERIPGRMDVGFSSHGPHRSQPYSASCVKWL